MNIDEYWDNLNEINRLCRLAKTSKSVDTLKELATSDDWLIGAYIQKNPHSTENVLLLLYAYAKFKKLKNEQRRNLITFRERANTITGY